MGNIDFDHKEPYYFLYRHLQHIYIHVDMVYITKGQISLTNQCKFQQGRDFPWLSYFLPGNSVLLRTNILNM